MHYNSFIKSFKNLCKYALDIKAVMLQNTHLPEYNGSSQLLQVFEK